MSITIREIILAFPPLKFIGDENVTINKIIQLDPANTETDILCWCSLKNSEKLISANAGTIIIPEGVQLEKYWPGCNYILVENPRQYFGEVIRKYFWKQDDESSISDKAIISNSVKIGKNPFIGANVVIREGCMIGDDVRILNNTIIFANTIIEDSVTIGANNVIGNFGFGYEKNTEGNYVLMPHIGNVIIRSNVEIGSNNCIDRAVLGSTIIGKHSKIHSFVQVGHGVQVGENCLVTANVTISGGTIIGNNVWFGPGVTVSNKLKVGSFAKLAMGSVILSDVPEGATVIGNPGRIIKLGQR